MQSTLALVALAAVAYAAPQGVTTDITPSTAAPAGFVTTYANSFQITAVNTTVAVAKRDISKRDACPTTDGALVITLTNGVLTDSKGRTGYIASNFQFQFDGPPQDGAIYTGGFSIGANSSLALGSSAVFYECLSGGFYNLYNENWAAQCEPILIDILPCGGSTTSGAVTQASDGQPAGTSVGTAVSQISDGQPQAQSAIPITQISDGQPQIPTAVISQISDGQIQQPTVAISQISDGQVQATTAVAATSTAVPISQISDGQVQATTSTAAAISQISDGQIQATTAAPTTAAATTTAIPISQISDGQVQAPNSTASLSATATPTPFTSLANTVSLGSGLFAAVVGLMAVILL